MSNMHKDSVSTVSALLTISRPRTLQNRAYLSIQRVVYFQNVRGVHEGFVWDLAPGIGNHAF